MDAAAGGCAFEIKNCRAYGNRTYGIVDNVQGAVSYDYCHLYGNYLATALAVDVSGTPGPTAGMHNIPAQTPPWIREWRRWPAYTTVTYDDPGLVQYSDTYVNGLLPMMRAKSVPLSIAVVTGGTYSQSIIGEVQGWINAGWDINTHSVSHEYWNPPSTTGCDDVNGPIPCDAFLLAYVGPGTYTMSITHSGGGGNLTLTASPYNATCYPLMGPDSGGCRGERLGWGKSTRFPILSLRCRGSRVAMRWERRHTSASSRKGGRTRIRWRTRGRVREWRVR